MSSVCNTQGQDSAQTRQPSYLLSSAAEGNKMVDAFRICVWPGRVQLPGFVCDISALQLSLSSNETKPSPNTLGRATSFSILWSLSAPSRALLPRELCQQRPGVSVLKGQITVTAFLKTCLLHALLCVGHTPFLLEVYLGADTPQEVWTSSRAPTVPGGGVRQSGPVTTAAWWLRLSEFWERKGSRC